MVFRKKEKEKFQTPEQHRTDPIAARRDADAMILVELTASGSAHTVRLNGQGRIGAADIVCVIALAI
jgi:hypothetical protein